MFCSKCGTQYKDGDAFCQKCGNRLKTPNNLQNMRVNPNNCNVYYIKERKPINFGVIGLICAIAILPVSVIIRFAFQKSVVKYGWRAYTATVLTEEMKIVGIILILALLIVSIVCLIISKRQSRGKNAIIIISLVIDALSTFFSFAVLLG